MVLFDSVCDDGYGCWCVIRLSLAMCLRVCDNGCGFWCDMVVTGSV